VRLAPLIGGDRLGGTVYRLPPGEVVRTPEGEQTLSPGDVVCFPAGPDGAHKVSAGTEEARVIIMSDPTTPAVAVYPDSDKVGVFTAFEPDRRRLFPRSAGVDYYDGEA
jgi:uncharacterized cupin superfamily protein